MAGGVSLRLGGPITMNSGTRGRIRVGPLLPGDQITGLTIYLVDPNSVGPSGTGIKCEVAIKAASRAEINSDAEFDALTDVILERTNFYAEFIQNSATDGYYMVRADVPLFAFSDQRQRNLFIDIDPGASYRGGCFLKIFRRDG